MSPLIIDVPVNDLRVVDEQFEEYFTAITSFGKVAEEQLTEYLRILAGLCDTAITEGSVAANFKAFSLHAVGLMGRIQEMCDLLQASNTSFLEAIDEADEYLY